MSDIKFKNLTLNARDYASQGNAVLGIRDSGKSYTSTFIAEKLMDAGIPIIAFDPIGLWRFLRVGSKGKGYPVVVAGGEHGDLPLTPSGAQEIVRAAMNAGVSVVFDLYSMDLSKADWKKIVEISVRTLLYENKKFGLRHIFVEEAAEFCPQRISPDQGKVYAEIEKLARMGGNALLGYTLINQRSEEVNKAVLELCDGMFLHRQKGRNSLTALSKWLDIGAASGGKEIISSLPTLPQGECWAWPAGESSPVHIKVPEKQTFHPDRRAAREENEGITQKTVNVSAFVEQMSSQLERLLAESEENNPEKLKARIRELESKKGNNTPSFSSLHDAEKRGFDRGRRSGHSEISKKLKHIVGKIRSVSENIANLASEIESNIGFEPVLENPIPVIKNHPTETKVRSANNTDLSNDPLLLAALSVWPAKMTWSGLASMCGRKARGGHFNTARKRLISEGLVREEGNLVVPENPPKSPEGIIPADLLEQNLPQPANKMFSAIRKNPGVDISALSSLLGMQARGGHWNTGMSTLRRNGLIIDDGSGLYIENSLLGERNAA